jgi:hypothetical protein
VEFNRCERAETAYGVLLVTPVRNIAIRRSKHRWDDANRKKFLRV